MCSQDEALFAWGIPCLQARAPFAARYGFFQSLSLKRAVKRPRNVPVFRSIIQRLRSPRRPGGTLSRMSTTIQYLLNVRQDTCQQPRTAEQIATCITTALFSLPVAFGHEFEDNRDDQRSLVKISDVVDERQRLASVDEADGWRITRGHNSGVN